MKDNAFKRMVDPIARKVALTIARAIVKLVDDEKGIQTMQIAIMKDELRDSVERLQDYGFTSVPHPGAEAVVAFVGGDRSHGVIIKVDDRRYRLTSLEAGEVAIYTDEGDSVHLKRGQKIEVTCGVEMTITCPKVIMTGDLRVNGDIKGDQEIEDRDGEMSGIRTIYNSHTHPENGTGGGTTSDPNQQMPTT